MAEQDSTILGTLRCLETAAGLRGVMVLVFPALVTARILACLLLPDTVALSNAVPYACTQILVTVVGLSSAGSQPLFFVHSLLGDETKLQE